jgi:hypothetical protein
VLKRGKGKEFSGVENDLFVEPKTSMLLGDARQSLLDFGLQVKRGLTHRIERFVQSPSTLRRSLCPCSLIQSKSVDWTKRRSPPRTRDATL